MSGGKDGLDLDARRRGAILGQFVGDALCLGSHWHYNLIARARLYPGGIEGFELPVEGHYHAGRAPGDPTHYGDAALLLLRSLVEAGGFDPVDYGQHFVAAFGDPAYRGYRDKPTLLTVQRWRDFQAEHPGAAYSFQDGPEDQQTVTMARLAPVVCRHLGEPGLLDTVARAVRVSQNHERTLAFHRTYARILAALLAGTPLAQAIPEAIAAEPGPHGAEMAGMLEDARALQSEGVVAATGEFGRSCYLANTFPAILHAALRHADDPATALIETARAGGDNASRAAVLGAWAGAAHGPAALPEAWCSRLRHRAEIEALTDRLLAAAPG
ncbi:MAG: ADP-ribosylglycohydrolase family protein [Geminicoccaceae bacterium]